MRERPAGPDLLATARDLFEAKLLPSLSGSQRHTARMIMRAMDLAMREMLAGTGPDEVERRGLESLFGGVADGIAEDDSRSALLVLNRGLIDKIRSGEADPGSPLHGPLLAHLRAVAAQRLALSNPRLLATSTAPTSPSPPPINPG